MDKPLILVVEDEVKQADMIAKLVEATGRYRVLKAYNGKEGLELLRNNKRFLKPNSISLILLDIKMPEMDGLQFLETMRKIYSDEQIGVIMLTAYEDEEKWERATSGFVIGYIKKPIVEEVLIGEIDKFYSDPEARVKMTLATFEKHVDKREEFRQARKATPEQENSK